MKTTVQDLHDAMMNTTLRPLSAFDALLLVPCHTIPYHTVENEMKCCGTVRYKGTTRRRQAS